jgi:sirohydrochlorin cobaltochelatase
MATGRAKAGLLLVAHGAPGGDKAAHRHAATLGRSGRFAEIAVGFLSAGPTPEAALATLESETVYVVPLFMAEGHFTGAVIPRRLGLQGPVTAMASGRRLLYCDPIGTSPQLAGLVERRLAALCRAARRAPKSVTALLIGHGSARNAGAASSAIEIARHLAAGGRFADVRAAFLDQSPTIEAALAAAADRPKVALGMFAAAGAHARIDVPRRLAAFGRDIPYGGAIGAVAGVAALIIERVRAFDRAAS